jgi:hypothetical protein
MTGKTTNKFSPEVRQRAVRLAMFMPQARKLDRFFERTSSECAGS